MKKPIEINKEILIELYKNKTKILDISKYFHCSVSTIRLKIKEFDIKLNTQKIYFIPKKGQKFNRLKFISEDKTFYNKKYWICECECGKIKSYDYYFILKGTVKSCGCYHKDNVKNYNWTGYKCIPGGYWNSLLKSSQDRNINFDITIKYAYYIYKKQHMKCKLSNLPIEFHTTNKNENFQASLDRIDNNKGYIKGNIQWVVKEINYMKNKIIEKNFIEFCKKINNFNNL